MAHGSNKQRSASECNKHTVSFSHVCSAFFSSFTFLLSLSLNSRKIVYFQFPEIPLFQNEYRSIIFLHDTLNVKPI